MSYALLTVAAIGHVILWAAIVNRLHGLGIERRWIDAATAACGLAMATLPLAVAALVWQRAQGRPSFGGDAAWMTASSYVILCAGNAVVAGLQRLWLFWHPERQGVLLANHTTRVHVRRSRGGPWTAPGIPTWLARLPGNQVLDLRVHEKRLNIVRWPAGREGLRLAHLSDFHMSGRIARAYYEAVVDEVNRLQPDLVAITGDLVERAACLDWLPDTLGRLRAAAGVYFVRGNHDRRVDEQRLLAAMDELGIVHLGGTTRQLTVHGTPILLAGNERPWFGTPPSDLPPRDADGLPLRILLAHGPDQYTWAREHDFDLMLAGHNHGGQVRLPLVGAILAPSLAGTRYASGAFRRRQTVLHVSRGTASLTPFRWNCPPEIALLVLASHR